jgi:hypothetical protein
MAADAGFFVVGCPRSGTTLVREILDGHPRLAVIDETHFVLGLAPRRWANRRPATLDDVLRHHRLPFWDVDPEALRAEVLAAGPVPERFPDFVDAVLSAYARLQGKARWGDKTPGYVEHIDRLAGWFPDARFVHVVRDGRHVAASLAERSWGSRTAVSGAFWWVRKVRAGRRAGERLGPERYLEVRLEDLVAEPEVWVERLCTFLGEAYDPSLLRYHERVAGSGRPLPEQERHLVLPPTAGLRDWRARLSDADAAAVEAVCSRALAELGYPPAPRTAVALARAAAIRARDLALTGARDVRTRLRPAERAF